MSFSRSVRRSSGLGSYGVVIMCVAALSVVLARSAPPRISPIYSASTVTSLAEHEHRLCFDHESFECGTSTNTALATPPPSASPHLSSTAPVAFEVFADGWHYNRPPPIG
jgi:hypothetical protein